MHRGERARQAPRAAGAAPTHEVGAHIPLVAAAAVGHAIVVGLARDDLFGHQRLQLRLEFGVLLRGRVRVRLWSGLG